LSSQSRPTSRGASRGSCRASAGGGGDASAPTTARDTHGDAEHTGAADLSEMLSVTALAVTTEVHMSVKVTGGRNRRRRSSQLKRSIKANAIVGVDVAGNVFMWNITEVVYSDDAVMINII
jgi:hypothetical protein